MLASLLFSGPAGADTAHRLRAAETRERRVEREVDRARERVEALRRQTRKLRELVRSSEDDDILNSTRFLVVTTARHLRVADTLQGASRRLEQLRETRRATLDRIEELRRKRRDELIRLSRLFQYCPVDQPLHYVGDFGVLSMRTKPHIHMGVDIFAPYGTPVRAAFEGTAVAAGNTIGGLAVKVYGPNGFVYNAHLAAYGQLGYVRAGTIIGYVGNSGNAAGTSPHNHFEWHPGNGPAVDPYWDLNEAC